MQQTLDNLRAFEARLRSTVEGLSSEQATRAEGPGKWSVTDVVAHLSDLELVYAVRIRTMLSGTAGDAPLPVLAQDAWVERVHRRESLAELLDHFAYHRHMNLTLAARLSDEELERAGSHPDYGRITIRDAFGRIERHDLKHLAQIERIKAAL